MLAGEAYENHAEIIFGRGGTFIVRSDVVPADIPGTYDLEFVNGELIMTLTIDDTVFKGVYISTSAGHVTFTVTEASGSNAGMVSIGASFTTLDE